MQRPESPPATGNDTSSRFWQELEEKLAPLEDSYLHWDQLQQKQMPVQGINHKQWWQLLKAKRRARLQKLPFLIDGQSFHWVLDDQLLKQLNKVERLLTITLPQMLDDKVPADHFIEETLATTQLAKLDINADNIRDFLQTGRPQREPQEQILFDYHQLLVNNQQSNMTAEQLLRFSTQENWRQGDANVLDQNVVLFTAPPSSSVVEGVEQILTFANQDENTEEAYLPSIVKAIILHFMICYLRPFEEGNGRSARALFYWQMQRAGYQHMAAISLSAELLTHRDDYYRAFLFTESDANDLTYFIMQQLNSLQHAIENFQQQRLAQQAKMAMLPSTLTHRQRHILYEMKSKPQQQYWVARYQQRMQITYETSRTDLRKLAKQGLLKKFKVGKAFVYQAADNDETQSNNQQQAG